MSTQRDAETCAFIRKLSQLPPERIRLLGKILELLANANDRGDRAISRRATLLVKRRMPLEKILEELEREIPAA